MGAAQPVAACQAGLEVLDRHRRPDYGRAAPRVLGVDDHGAVDRVLERSQARFEHHLLLAYIVVLVVVRALAVRPRLAQPLLDVVARGAAVDRKSTRLNSSHLVISYAVFCLKKKK